ncbi:hypothetical protein ABT112_01180 [Streptomyces sp. NPDC002055]|uniref:hypothetical protein n=1 Tax=Streptomyces sp. NPDC002055 TaxID=3154534 RepID=UPI003316F08B
MAVTHARADRPAVALSKLGDERWMVDPAADDDCAALRSSVAAPPARRLFRGPVPDTGP